MAKKTLVIEVEVDLLEDWTDEELTANSVFFFEAALRHEEQEQTAKFPNPPFTVDSDVTVWTKQGYIADWLGD